MTKQEFNPEYARINNDVLEYYRINNDVNGNPRYVVHFLSLDIEPADYGNIKGLAARKYHNKQFGGGYVFQSYNVKSHLTHLVDQVSEYYEVNQQPTCDKCGKVISYDGEYVKNGGYCNKCEGVKLD